MNFFSPALLMVCVVMLFFTHPAMSFAVNVANMTDTLKEAVSQAPH